MTNLRECGWVWEGQGLDPDVHPSIFGVGEGARYFGLDKVHFLFHPNTTLAMAKLTDMGIREIVCDISKWCYVNSESGGTRHQVDATPARVRAEAELVSTLSLQFPRVTGAIHDDMKGLVNREKYTPADYAPIYVALKSRNPKLKLWTVVYSHELVGGANLEFWRAFAPYVDVVEYWIWEAKNIPPMDDAVARCREVFPDKPIVMGCYLRDYPTRAPVPMPLLKQQWERVVHHVHAGNLAGYAILATVLIDEQQEQANWVRDVIRNG